MLEYVRIKYSSFSSNSRRGLAKQIGLGDYNFGKD